ncbi:MAG: ATP-dependent Clp protease ATP-binding subunit ClpX [Lachnospiraceae bacterium]|nr:ATP-dependent Clp protease ATP-binding subunit ClpX [Lachnospiraceae bacterium]
MDDKENNLTNNNNDIIKNDDDNKYEDICYMCRRPESQTGRLLKMAGSFCVCADCMQKTFNLMNAGDIPGFPVDNNMGAGKNNDKNNDSANNFGFNPFGFNFGFLGDVPKSQRLKKKAAPQESSDGSENVTAVLDFRKLPPPHKIKESLDEYVIGQDKAKKVISVAVYNHYKRVTKDASGDIEIGKSNMLMIGPTGCGKTYLVQTLARILNVPLAITDATSLTEAGYIGDDVESVLSKLLMAADNDVERAETGIVFIDEIDKIAKKKNTTSRDVSGESVQQGLLRILEGADVQVPVGASSKNAMVPMTTINTRNILFICGGAFPELDKIIKKRLLVGSGIGFNSILSDKYDEDDVLSHVSNEDLREFGMIPEFIGRLPVVYTLSGLDKDMLVKIMSEPKNAILKQYQKLLALDDVELFFDDDALEAIADKALEKETGARGLRSIIEEFMLDIMYEIPKDRSIGRVTITRDYIESKGGPRIELHGTAPMIHPLSEGGGSI